MSSSCHIDTCHHDEGYQRLSVCNDDQGIAYVRTRRGEGNCLGADDGTGVWLMLEMIAAARPGRYIFHRGEERGCKGSQWIADNNKAALENATAAIAFDRRDFNNIITHQGGERGCSEAFATSIANQLPGFKPDPSGLFTDTRKYFRLVPECTNLSVGYQSQHGPLERQYLDFAASLRTAMLTFDTKLLTIERDPTKYEYRHTSNYSGGYHGGNNSRHYDHSNNSYRYNPRSDADPDNANPDHWIHRANGSNQQFYVWSRTEGKNILRINAKFVYGPGGGYKTMSPAEADKAAADRVRAQQTMTASERHDPPPGGAKPKANIVVRAARAEDSDQNDDLNADDELFDIQLELDLERNLGQLCFHYPTAAAKLLESAGIDTNDMLQMVYGEYLDDALDFGDDDDADPDPAEDTTSPPPASECGSLTAASTSGLVQSGLPIIDSEGAPVLCGLCQGDGNVTQCQFPGDSAKLKCCLRHQTLFSDMLKPGANADDDAQAEGEAIARAFAEHDAARIIPRNE